MNKAELIDVISTNAGLSKVDAKRALDAFVGATTEELKNEDGRVSLVGFGSFTVAKRAARTGRNPKNGEAIEIAAKNVVRFKTGSDLADAINKAD
ncbi:MAG: DNA-binding protein HU-beta [Alteromonas macleodii]|jgi:DNA-binding protein HU-beta